MPPLNLPPSLYPREKILAIGADKLTDIELIAIILRTGSGHKNVLELAHDLLETFNGLAGLLNAKATELSQVCGLGGTAKRAELLAILELAKRAIRQELENKDTFVSPEKVKQFLQLNLSHHKVEVFSAMFLDNQFRLISYRELSRGTHNQTHVYPREVVKLSLELDASALLLAHNHPSGVVYPSAADKTITSTIKSALEWVNVRVLDHIIVGQGSIYSMAEAGQI
ncbi:MAG: DNA repair protein RadC [Gammaproteobacteria bacterium]|nr:DNA repair protein RadC [Gammaproteobacteria bacterium]